MSYPINKGINRPIEFKGLKAQYIGYLGGGLVIILVLFAILYLIGMAIYLCLLIIGGMGSLLFYKVLGLSHRYGQHGLIKKNKQNGQYGLIIKIAAFHFPVYHKNKTKKKKKKKR